MSFQANSDKDICGRIVRVSCPSMWEIHIEPKTNKLMVRCEDSLFEFSKEKQPEVLEQVVKPPAEPVAEPEKKKNYDQYEYFKRLDDKLDAKIRKAREEGGRKYNSWNTRRF